MILIHRNNISIWYVSW